MRYQGRVTAAALAAAALILLVSSRGRAEDAGPPAMVPVNGFGPYAVPPMSPYGGFAPNWGGSPRAYGWGAFGPQFWPPQYGYGGWPPGYGSTNRQATPRRPRATRPYWAGPRWRPRNTPNAWNDGGYGYGNRPNRNSTPNPGWRYANPGWYEPYGPRPWRGQAGRSQYGYAGAR